MAFYQLLDDRGVLRLTGEDRVAFLQGLTSNDVSKAAPGRVIFSAFLTPQGKYLHDFFIAATDDALLLECEAGRRDDLLRRLRVYKLRAKVALEDMSGQILSAALFGDGVADTLGLPAEPGAARPFGDGGLVFVDPRLAALGARALLPVDAAAERLEQAGFIAAAPHAYENLRLSLGVPDGSRDLMVERSALLESNFDELNAIAWDKGCYLGQELTARTRYRGLVRKRLMPVAVDGPLPAPGTPILVDGKAVGEIRSGHGDQAMALIRLEALATPDVAFRAGDVPVRPRKPDYARF